LISATLLLANAAFAQTQTWDLATDYPTSLVNPNGAWTYGYWDASYTTFTLYIARAALSTGGGPQSKFLSVVNPAGVTV